MIHTPSWQDRLRTDPALAERVRRDPELRALLRERERRAKIEPHRRYTCHQKMRAVHLDPHPIRCVMGGNRVGKTTGGAWETVCAAMGYNPISKRRYPTGQILWAVALNNKKQGAVMRAKLRQFLPVGGYKEYFADGVFRLSRRYGGSEIFCMSCEAGPEAFQAFGLIWIWFDEMPRPRGLEIFDESYARIEPEHELYILLTFTAPQGYPWAFRRLWNPNDEMYLRDENGEDTLIGKHTLDLHDASVQFGGHMSEKKIAQQEAKYGPAQRATRIHGGWSLVSDDVFFNGFHIVKAKERAIRGTAAYVVVDELKQTRIVWPFLPPAKAGEEPRPNPEWSKQRAEGWEIVRQRIPFERYRIGFDVSAGKRKDRSVAYVLSCGVTGPIHVAARFKSDDIAPHVLARQIAYPLLLHYNRAEAIPEVNGEYGGAFLNELQHLYRKIYVRVRFDQTKGKYTQDLGWRTDDKTRGMLFTSVERALATEFDLPGSCPVFTKSVCDELGTIVIKRNEDGDERVEHAEGAFDDEFFALAIPLTVNYMGRIVTAKPLEEVVEMYEHLDPRLAEIG